MAVVLLGLATPARAQDPPVPTWNDCFQQVARPGPSGEIYGPTRINAQSANQRMAVGVARDGTVTVLRWPRPSFYDQIKHRTSSRYEPRFGALPNEGAFLGLATTTTEGTRTVWLADLESPRQVHDDDLNDVITTTYRDDERGLSITVEDVVAHDVDAFLRRVTVDRDADSPVTAASLVAFENLNLVVTKIPYIPALDWCGEELNTDTATYDADLDTIVHTKEGVDTSVGEPRTVAVGMALVGTSDQHQVGGDAYEGNASPDARVPGSTQDAYDDAADGFLQGNGTYTGQTTGALTAPLDLTDGSATETVVLAGAPDAAEVAVVIAAVRDRDFDDVVAAKRSWFDALLADAPWPATDHPDVLAVARRALVTLVSTYDPRSGAIVASIATQSPYGEDWIRDGAFFNHVLDLIGHHDWVDQRNRWYADLQSKGEGFGEDNPFVESTQQGVVPPGNWAMNYYADGVVGGPIPWEIDETGYGLWTFWDHHDATGDVGELRAVYPAIQRAADFLTTCLDPRDGLQCVAIEDDNPEPRQTIHGAGPVFLGLDSAVRAAEVLGETADRDRWGARRDELRAAIETHLYVDGSYGGGNGEIVWPVCFHPLDHERFADSHYEAMWTPLARTFAEPEAGGQKLRGLYEAKRLIPLAKAKRDDPAWRARVLSGLEWIATEHAQPDTHVMGEEWLYEDGDIVSTVSQPHVWEQVLFYLGALEAFPPDGLEPEPGCGGVIAALRDRPGGGGGDDAGSDEDSATAPAPLPATGGPGSVLVALLTVAAGVGARRRS